MIVEEKEKQETTTVILLESRYGILRVPNNFVVARIKDSIDSMEVRGKDFDTSTYTFHPTLAQALKNLSNRLLEGKLRTACKNRPLQLKELKDLIEAHHTYFINLTRGT